MAVEDKSGAVVSTDNSTVTLSLTGGTFADGTTRKTARAGNGVATFNNVVFGQVGTYTLIASDGVLFPATSPPIIITPGQASKLVFLQSPSTANTATVLSPSVRVAVEDQYGNVVTGDNSQVSLSAWNPPGSPFSFVLSGATGVSAVSGIASFPELYFAAVGQFQAGYQLTVHLVASDGSLQQGTSLNILVTVG